MVKRSRGQRDTYAHEHALHRNKRTSSSQTVCAGRCAAKARPNGEHSCLLRSRRPHPLDSIATTTAALQHVRRGPVQRRRCHRLRRTAAAFSPLVAGFRLEGFCEHTGLDHESRAAEDKRTVKGSKAMAAACEECAGRGSCGCHAEGPRTAGEQPRARAQHGHRGANGGAVRHRRALSAELSPLAAAQTAEVSYYRA